MEARRVPRVGWSHDNIKAEEDSGEREAKSWMVKT